MDSSKLLLIGEISKACNIPIKTLRYYDEIGILKPARINTQNKYRYYTKQQIVLVNIIKDLKELGFSLNEIKKMLKREDLTYTQNEIKSRITETKDEISKIKNKLSKLNAYKDMLTKGIDLIYYDDKKESGYKHNKFEIKRIPRVKILYTRYKCPCNPSAFITRYSELFNLLERDGLYKVGPLMAIFHDHYTEFDYNCADIEVGTAIEGMPSSFSSIRDYGGFLAATSIHYGSYKCMIDTYKDMMIWIDENKYELSGPATEKYIIDSATTKFEENYVTEIILPIKKKI